MCIKTLNSVDKPHKFMYLLVHVFMCSHKMGDPSGVIKTIKRIKLLIIMNEAEL